MDQWVEWITRPAPEYQAPNIDWIIAVFTITKNDYGNPEQDIKPWSKPMGALKNPLKKRCNL